MKIRYYGPDALLIEAPDEEQARNLDAKLAASPLQGQLEVTIAFATLLVEFNDPSNARSAAEHGLKKLEEAAQKAGTPPPRIHNIPVTYGGPDLHRVARLAKMLPEEVIQRHQLPEYTVGALGFQPGFAYLEGLDERLQIPRLDHPRTKVEAGSVAIGGSHTGIYPAAGPGGWNIIGVTAVRLFDPLHALEGKEWGKAFLLHPGDRVRFIPVGNE